MFIAETDSDEINLLACMIAQTDSRAKIKVARIRTHEFQQWERILGEMGLDIDRIIRPETQIMQRIMRVLHIPGVSDILDFADGAVKPFGMNVSKDNWQTTGSLPSRLRGDTERSRGLSLAEGGSDLVPIAGAMALTVIAGSVLWTLCRAGTRELSQREGILLTVGAWIGAGPVRKLAFASSRQASIRSPTLSSSRSQVSRPLELRSFERSRLCPVPCCFGVRSHLG